MPPKTSKASKKRPLEDADSNKGPSAKKPTTAKGNQGNAAGCSADMAPSQGVSSAPPAPAVRRISRGPNGEGFMPRIMPAECAKDLKKKIPVPQSWLTAIDATPNREMTLRNREWWEDHGPWLEAHKKRLSLCLADWKLRDGLMAEEVTLKEDEGNNDWDFVCVPMPAEEDDWESEDNSSDDSEEHEESEEPSDKAPPAGRGNNSEAAAVVGKLASLHPEYVWVFSMLGEERSRWWILETLKRDQDEFAMHIYNDFSNYGRLEVLENIFLHFVKVCKRNATYREVWSEVEGLALLLQTDLIDFTMIDDPDRAGEVIELIGNLTITAIDLLKTQGVLRPKSEIPNIGLVLALLVHWVWGQIQDVDCWDENGSWIFRVIELAEEASITLTGPSGFATELNDIKEREDLKSLSKNKWKSVTWASQVKSYQSRHGGQTGPRARPSIGGHHFDITKMSAGERKDYSFA